MNITKRLLLFENGGLPQEGLLFYSRLPNSEAIPWDEEATYEDNMLFGGWILPEIAPLILEAAPLFYDGGNSPLLKTGADILSMVGINTAQVLFSWRRGLAIYALTTPLLILARAKKIMKIV